VQAQVAKGSPVGFPPVSSNDDSNAAALEADEMFQDAEKSTPHEVPDDPPRERANKRRGCSTFANDRPLVLGLVDRGSGQIRLHVCVDTKQATIEPLVREATEYGQVIYTDEAGAYNHIDEFALVHMTVCHSDGNEPRTSTTMASTKCTASAKESGRDCGTSCARFSRHKQRVPGAVRRYV
jgi:transposase-like protein